MQKLPSKAVYYFFINNLIAFLFLFGFLEFMIIALGIGLATDGNFALLLFFPITLIIWTATSLGLAYLLAKLSYDNFGYQIGDDVIIIESGVVVRRHVSIPYGRIQNVDIVRGPIAQLMGLADLQIQTAGISGVNIMEGRIPALFPNDSEKLKNDILSKLQGAERKSGL